MIRIALDASGGDQAPDTPIDGVSEALRNFTGSVKVTLIGRRAEAVERSVMSSYATGFVGNVVLKSMKPLGRMLKTSPNRSSIRRCCIGKAWPG